MKLFFVSDIHGSLYYAKKAVELFEKEKADYIVLLGDVLYHGPRNPLPKDYNPQEVAELMNSYKDKIIAVRGNCDSEVDQMVIDYPMMSDSSTLFYEGRRIFATHGHIFNKTNMPYLSKGDIFIHGHFHLPMAERLEEVYYLNPGSISLPKMENPNSYAVLEGNLFEIKDIEGVTIKSLEIQ